MEMNENKLDQFTTQGHLFTPGQDNGVQCLACAHQCIIKPGKRGICKMRFNSGGNLFVPSGYVAGAQIDPIEKKPMAHFLPGSDALTFGMLGCNLHCSFCQNWLSSQTFRDPDANSRIQHIQQTSPEQIASFAHQNGAAIIASSYNEPLITTEWAVEIFKLSHERSIKNVFISNGYATPTALDYLRPHLDGYKVDLKTMQESQYRQLGGSLAPVLDTIQRAYDLDLWVEVVTLVIPDYNDSVAELWDIARFLVSVSPDIPWHVTAFHPDYRMNDRGRTPAETLIKATEIGQEAGLHYVYAGNLLGRVGSLEDTICLNCQLPLIRRKGYQIHEYQLTADGACPKCKTKIAGVWSDKPDKVHLGGWGMPRLVRW
jgi:pyruvate formate lyase activating enzyme